MKLINISLQHQTILITGAAGFIGSNLVLELLRSEDPVHIIGIDNMNDYYDVSIKEYRLEKIKSMSESKPDSTWTFIKGSISDQELVNQIFPGISAIDRSKSGSAGRRSVFHYESGRLY